MTQEKINILIVDDRRENLLVLESVLEELGQNVIAAYSGADALRQVMEHDFAVILLDVNMPDLDGYETAALIRRRKKSAHTPIIFVTAYADDTHTAHAYTLGAVDFILSPVIPEILRSKVRVFVELSRMTQQIKQQANEQVALAREQAARSAAEESVRRLRVLAEASELLFGSLKLDERLTVLLRLVVTQRGDYGLIALLDEQGNWQQYELAWIDPGDGFRASGLANTYFFEREAMETLRRTVAEGEQIYFPEGARAALPILNVFVGAGAPAPHPPGQIALATLPLVARGRTLGVLCLVREDSRWSEAADRTLLEDLTHRSAVAIDNARLYHEVQEADRRKNEFLSMLAHELRNPLAPLLNGIDILRLHGPANLEIQKIQEMMDRQVHHLVRLVDDLLDVSRISRDMVELQRETVAVAVIVERAVEVSRPQLEARGHQLILTLPPNPVWLYADPVRLAQVLSNLLNNAAKYTPMGGTVWIAVENDNAQVSLRVRDNGIGIPSEMLSSIFEPFTQVTQSLDRSEGRLGIGLTLVRRLVQMHGGSVQAHCAGLNQGSEFIVRLPTVEASSVHCQPEKTQAPQIQRRRVLVVDDNRDVADSTAMVLRLIGSEVQVANDGQAALAAVLSFQPEIVLLDIGLPGMDGFEVARRLRRQVGVKQPLLVALSGYAQEEDRKLSAQAGFDLHLVKPANLLDLKALVAEAKVHHPEQAPPDAVGDGNHQCRRPVRVNRVHGNRAERRKRA